MNSTRLFIPLLAFPLTTVIFLASAFTVWASAQFETTFTSRYLVSTAGQTQVEQRITLENRFSDIFATEYSLQVGSIRLDQIKATSDSGEPLPVSTNFTDNSTAITVSFPDRVVGKGQQQTFTISYTNPDVTSLNGQVLEMYIPRISNLADIEHLTITLEVPQAFGFPALTNPSTFTTGQTAATNTITFERGQLKDQGITVLFGNKQVYALTLNYHLENPSSTNGITQIALPPDTPYQKIYLNTLEPEPEKLVHDADGNWLATYGLDPKQRLDIIVQAQVEVFMKPTVQVPVYQRDLNIYLEPREFWPTQDPTVQELAKTLNTPEAIYQFLVENFTYNYQRLDSLSAQRLGALTALENPENVICQEFTDTFITLARAAGIPAREHNGYAFTNNERLRPLSLVRDVLHSWPEYYDQETKTWIPIDPTWGNTTGGVDYFNTLDLNHITFAIHGLDSSRPYPAGYYKLEDTKEKDITVAHAATDPELVRKFNFSVSHIPSSIFGLASPARLHVTNTSNTALYNIPITLSGTDYRQISPATFTIDKLLPLEKQEVSFYLTPKSILLTRPATLSISAYQKTLTYEIYPFKNTPFWILLLAFLVVAGLGAAGAFIAWRLLVSRLRQSRALRR